MFSARKMCLIGFEIHIREPENFQRENLSELIPTESLRTQDSENVFGLGD